MSLVGKILLGGGMAGLSEEMQFLLLGNRQLFKTP